jgi:hypothetical protein
MGLGENLVAMESRAYRRPKFDWVFGNDFWWCAAPHRVFAASQRWMLVA